jgi:D-alanine-D-alanine ligase
MAQRKRNDYRCDIVLLVDEETGARGDDGQFVPDRDSAEVHVLRCLSARFRQVAVVPFDPAIVPTVEALRSIKPRLVFNLTEWVDGDRSLDAAIAGLLEIMNQPYTGTGPTGLRIARDKVLSKRIVAGLGVAVPRHYVLRGTRVRSRGLSFPIIIKPQFGDGSEEMSKGAVAENARELEARVRSLRSRIREPLLCEEYVEGRDLYVGLLGNPPRALPPLELLIGKKRSASPRFATWRVKHDARYRTKWRIRFREARLPAAVAAAIDGASRSIFRALKLRDYARIDYRLTPDNRLYFLEANPNPDLSPHTFGRNRCFAGVAYPDLIETIVAAALKRSRA